MKPLLNSKIMISHLSTYKVVKKRKIFKTGSFLKTIFSFFVFSLTFLKPNDRFSKNENDPSRSKHI